MENGSERREGRERCVSVAVDKDKSSQHALKWAVENLVTRGQTLRLVHVTQRTPLGPNQAGNGDAMTERQLDIQNLDLFLPFRCFCLRRQIQCEMVVLEDPDVAKALIEYITQNGVETMLLGAASKNGLSRLFRITDVPGIVLKWAPDFCNVYVVSKGKLSGLRSASRPVPVIQGISGQPLRPQNSNIASEAPSVISFSREGDGFFPDDLMGLDRDISFVSSGRASTDSTFLSFYENLGSTMPMDSSRRSNATARNLDMFSGSKPPIDFSCLPEYLSTLPIESGRTSCSSICTEDLEDEVRRLKVELKQTMDMYHAACKEALTAKHKVMELQEWKVKEEKRIQEAHGAEEAAALIAQREQAKVKAAIEAAEAATKIVELEWQKRVETEMKALREAGERKKVLDALGQSQVVLKYQSLFHILAVIFLFHFYFSVFK